MARAIGCRLQGIPFIGWNEREAGGGCHLNDSGIAIGEDAELCVNFVSEGREHTARLEVSTGGIDKGLHGAFAAVCHRNFLNSGIRENAAEACLHRICGLQCSDAAFE